MFKNVFLTAQKKHYVTNTKTCKLMLLGELIAIFLWGGFYKTHNRACRQNIQFLAVEEGQQKQSSKSVASDVCEALDICSFPPMTLAYCTH